MRPSIVIVGAGVSGLAAAWELAGTAGGTNGTIRIEVIEAAARTGGTLTTTNFAGRTIDLGPDGFLARRPEAVTLVHELAMADQLVPIATSGAAIFLRDQLRALPPGLAFGVPTSLAHVREVSGLRRRARWRARRDLYAPARLRVNDDLTIGEIVRRKLGRDLTYQLVEPMIGGIQAGRVDNLSARAVAPELYRAAQRGGSLMRALADGRATVPASHGPVFYTLRRGVGSLTTELDRQLRERGVVIRTGTGVTRIRRTPAGTYPLEVDAEETTTPANAVILCTPPQVAASLLGVEGVLDELGRVTSAGAAMVTSVVTHATLPAGTGVLVPLATPWPGAADSLLVTALTFLDRKWPHLARPGESLIRAHVGRSDDARWRNYDDAALSARVHAEIAHLLGPVSVGATIVQRWPDSLPQYEVGHDEMVARVRERARTSRVWLAGMAYDGVGIPASIGSGRRAAREVLEQLA